jgi:hypothetical protein
MQRTALRAAADAERYTNIYKCTLKKLKGGDYHART